MTTNALLNEPVTTMFTDRVKPDRIAEYDAWSAGINGDVKQFPGFLSVDVIRPEDSDHPEYITLVKFNSCKHLKRWRESPNAAKWMEKLPNLLAGSSHKQEGVGLELWFDRPNSSQSLKEPPFWKQVLIGVICVYPLILILIWALAPFTASLPSSVALLLNVIILSSLLTYPVMPWITRLLRPWLYSKSTQSVKPQKA